MPKCSYAVPHWRAGPWHRIHSDQEATDNSKQGNHLFPLKAFKKIITKLHDRSWVFGRLEWYRNMGWMLHESRLFGWRESKLSEWSPVGSHQKWRHVTNKTLAMHSINQLCNTKTKLSQSQNAVTLKLSIEFEEHMIFPTRGCTMKVKKQCKSSHTFDVYLWCSCCR